MGHPVTKMLKVYGGSRVLKLTREDLRILGAVETDIFEIRKKEAEGPEKPQKILASAPSGPRAYSADRDSSVKYVNLVKRGEGESHG